MNAKITVFFNYSIRLIVLIASVVFLYFQLKNKIPTDFVSNALHSLQSYQYHYLLIFMLLLLMVLNWCIEIVKWYLLAHSFAGAKFSDCLKGVLSGITISMFLPNRVGDVAGKVLWLKPGYRWEGFFANFYTSLAQIVSTILLTAVACVFFITQYDAKLIQQINNNLVLGIVFSLLLLLITLYFNLGFLSLFFKKINFLRMKKIGENAQVLRNFSFNQKFIVLILSILRFSIYCIQYYMLIHLFGLHLNFMDGFFLIVLIYFAITIVPQFAIAEIATRGALALIVFDIFIGWNISFAGNAEGALLMASTALWFINLFVPAMTGLLMLPDINKISLKKQ